MIENAIGTFQLPLGIAQNFLINGREVPVPMAIEEPSVVAGASFMARLARSGGGFITTSDAPEMIGQIQILDLTDPQKSRKVLLEHKNELLAEAAKSRPDPGRSGWRSARCGSAGARAPGAGQFPGTAPDHGCAGCHGRQCGQHRCRTTGAAGREAHRRAGSPAHPFQPGGSPPGPRDLHHTNGPTGVRMTIPAEKVRDGILEAWAFAAADPYRAATHNKGIMNGVDAVRDRHRQRLARGGSRRARVCRPIRAVHQPVHLVG